MTPAVRRRTRLRRQRSRQRRWPSPARAGPALGPASTRKPRSVPAEGPGSPLREGNRVLAEVRFDHGAARRRRRLRAAGAKVLDASRRYQTVTVAVRPGRPARRSTRRRRRRGRQRRCRRPSPTAPAARSTPKATPSSPPPKRATDFGVDGSGVTVGILSDSFDTDYRRAPTHAADDVASGDLPGAGNPCGYTAPVERPRRLLSPREADRRGQGHGADRPRPGAGGEDRLRDGVQRAKRPSPKTSGGWPPPGASVIVDDVAYFEEPFFQDGPVAVAIDEVVAEGRHLLLGRRQRQPDRRRRATTSPPGKRRHSATPAAARRCSKPRPPLKTDHCLDFDPGAGAGEDNDLRDHGRRRRNADRRPAVGRTLERGQSRHRRLPARRDRQTAARWRRIWSAAPRTTSATKATPAAGRGRSAWENEGAGNRSAAGDQPLLQHRRRGRRRRLQPGRLAAAKPRLKLILLQNGGGVSATEYPESAGGDVVGPSIYGHAGAAAAISLGAIRAGVTSAPEASPRAARSPTTSARSAARRRRRRSTQTIPKPDVGRHRLRPHDLLRARLEPGDLPLLRHLGRGAARRGDRRPCAAGEPVADAGPDRRRAGGHREAGRRLRARRRRRRPRSTPTGCSKTSPCRR